jgi:hypothetical protein
MVSIEPRAIHSVRRHLTRTAEVMTKKDLQGLVVEALRGLGGSASLIDVCRFVWEHHELELRESGDLFYAWQYEIRWAAHELRVKGTMRSVNASPPGVWELET